MHSRSLARRLPTILATVAMVAACAGATPPRQTREPEGLDVSALPSASAPPRTKREARRLAPAPASLTLGQFWPTRICTRGPTAFIVETSCGCDSRMTCAVTQRGSVLDLHIGATQELCKDCGTFAATCTVPPGARPRGKGATSLRITLDGKPALDALELRGGDGPAIEHCYE